MSNQNPGAAKTNSPLLGAFATKAELLNGELFYSLAEARIVIESWRQHYNTQRPHSSLGYKPPAPPAVLWPGPPPSSTMAAKPTMH